MAHAVKHIVFVSWGDVQQLVGSIVTQIRDDRFDLVLGISRGGLIPTTLIALRLGIVNIVTASVQNSDHRGLPLPEPLVIQFPPPEVFAGQRVLIIDDMVRSGHTMGAVVQRARACGANVHAATLHIKPEARRRNGRPTIFGEETDLDPIYPWSKEKA